MSQSEEIEVGDHVFVGNGKVHWIVTEIHQGVAASKHWTYANLKSGMTGRTRGEFTKHLRLHSKGQK